MHIWLVIGLAVCWLMMALQTKKAAACALSVVLSAVFGLIAGRLLYVALLPESSIMRYGLEALYMLDESRFSLFGAACGAVAGAALSARFLRASVKETLNLFAPCAAVLLCFLRIGEQALGTLGAGDFVNAESFFARFPFTITNAYGEHLFALFYVEALCALVCAAAFWKSSRRAEKIAFFLALCQIFCESLRARCMKWGFVRIEQLLCGLLVLGMLFWACQKRQSAQKTRYLPLAIGFVSVACIGVLEWALDKTGIPVPVCYLLMAGALGVMGWMELRLLSKRDH